MLMMSNGENKLSRFNGVANIGLQPELINKHLNQMFSLSKKAINNLKVFFQQYKIEDQLNFNGSNNYDEICQTMMKDIQNNNFKEYPGKEADQLPFHLNDINWLANYLVTFLKKAEPKVNFDVAEIQEFITTSPAVAQARTNFEQTVVKTLIKINMEKGLGRLIGKRSRQRNLTSYEEIFRNKILCCADTLGADHHNAEITLESNANLWRKQNMQRAFAEFYYPAIERPINEVDFNNWRSLAEDHYQEWIKCREYEYYTKHRNVLIEAGPDAVTENMMISQIRYAVMAKQLCEYNKDRKAMFLANQQSCDVEDNINI